MKLSENYVKSTRRYIMDTNLIPFHWMPLDKFNAEEYVKALAEAHVNCIFQETKDHRGYAFYDTKVGIKSPRLKTDFLADVIKHAHSRGIMVNAYYSLGHDSAI